MTRIHVQYSDCGEHIRKWSREPFEGGVAYEPAPVWNTNMDEAPRDGTEVLLLMGETIPGNPYIRVGSFINQDDGEELGYWQGWLIWMKDAEDYEVVFEDSSSAWMPLPDGPEEV